MFAEQLGSDSVVVPRAHLGNPSSIPADVVWQMASREVRPRHKLDLGPDHYTLYFDKNSRLRWYGGDRPRHDEWSVAKRLRDSDCRRVDRG